MDLIPEFVPGRTIHRGLAYESDFPPLGLGHKSIPLQSYPKNHPSLPLSDPDFDHSKSTLSDQQQLLSPISATAYSDTVFTFDSTYNQSSSEGPPPNAPTGPSALRKSSGKRIDRGPPLEAPNKQPDYPAESEADGTFENSPVDFSNLQLYYPNDSASWSQSKVWVSMEAQEKAGFQKLIANLKHIRAENSPAVPQTMAEYMALKRDAMERRKRELCRLVAKLEDGANHRKKKRAQEEGASARSNKLMWGRVLDDQLSPFFAVDTCWNPSYSTDAVPSTERVDWPPLAAFKDDGDERGRQGFGRYLPLPRQNKIDPRIFWLEGDAAYNDDGSLDFHKKATMLDRFDLMPRVDLVETYTTPSVEIMLDELPTWQRMSIEGLGVHAD